MISEPGTSAATCSIQLRSLAIQMLMTLRIHGLISAYAYLQTARKYALNTQYAPNNDWPHPQNRDASLVSARVTWQCIYSTGKKNPKALCVDLIFTVESPKSVNCDAMTNSSCLDENSVCRWRRSRVVDIVDIVSLKFGSNEAACWKLSS